MFEDGDRKCVDCLFTQSFVPDRQADAREGRCGVDGGLDGWEVDSLHDTRNITGTISLLLGQIQNRRIVIIHRSAPDVMTMVGRVMTFGVDVARAGQLSSDRASSGASNQAAV